MIQIKSFLNFWNLVGFPPAVLGNIGNEYIFKIGTTDKSRTFTDILMRFFFRKFISEIHEYSQKAEKFSSSLWMHILLLGTYAI